MVFTMVSEACRPVPSSEKKPSRFTPEQRLRTLRGTGLAFTDPSGDEILRPAGEGGTFLAQAQLATSV